MYSRLRKSAKVECRLSATETLPIAKRIRQISAGEAFALAAVLAVLAGVMTYFSIRVRLEANQEMRTSAHAVATVTEIVTSRTGRYPTPSAHASWTDGAGRHTVSFTADDGDHPSPGTRVEVVYDPKTPQGALTLRDLYNTPRFLAVFTAIVWAGVVALCLYGAYARIHPTLELEPG